MNSNLFASALRRSLKFFTDRIFGKAEINPLMMAAAKEFVNMKIKGKKVVVFSKSYCPYCKTAKTTLKKYPINPDEYEEIEIEDKADCDAIQDYLKEITGGRSVPRIFINEEFIGGCDDTVAKDDAGELKTLLEKSGVI